jgi:hypothetical protein
MGRSLARKRLLQCRRSNHPHDSGLPSASWTALRSPLAQFGFADRTTLFTSMYLGVGDHAKRHEARAQCLRSWVTMTTGSVEVELHTVVVRLLLVFLLLSVLNSILWLSICARMSPNLEATLQVVGTALSGPCAILIIGNVVDGVYWALGITIVILMLVAVAISCRRHGLARTLGYLSLGLWHFAGCSMCSLWL